jgi:Zn-dependent peptidase ImmA (M78 family)
MEWQANALAPRILMPADMMKLKYEQVKAEIVASGETDLREIYKQTINKLADFSK